MDRNTRCTSKKLRHETLWVFQSSESRTLEQAYERAQTLLKLNVPARQFT